MKTDSPILITSAYSITDEKLQVIENKHINKEVIRINENSFVKDCSFPGMTFCVNKKLIQLAKEKYDEENVFYHDYFLSLLAINYGEMFCVGSSTVLYRQHMNNQLGSGGRGKENRTHWKKVLQQKENEMIMVNAFSKNADIYEDKLNFSLKRKSWFENRKIYCVIFNLFNYLKFYNMKSFLADLYYCVRK